MAIPVISNTTSVLGYRKGQYFEYQMQATNTPTSWTANGLPSGMSISSSGLVSGAATAAGVYLVRFIATQCDGPSRRWKWPWASRTPTSTTASASR